tara:strand:- start:12852 stop:13199 length:348 start_codon:yes stop_codon:yes gene_type:complete
MDEKEIKKKMKQFDLKKGHYYIILTDMEDGKFEMVAYDTTNTNYRNEMDHSVGSVMHEGLVGLLQTKGEDLYNFGMSELAFKYTTGRLFNEMKDNTHQTKPKYRDNVIEVDFGKD